MVKRRSLRPSLGFRIIYDEAVMSPHVPSVSVTMEVETITIFQKLRIFVCHSR
jgi:hypothetical protein